MQATQMQAQEPSVQSEKPAVTFRIIHPLKGSNDKRMLVVVDDPTLDHDWLSYRFGDIFIKGIF